MLPKSSQRKKFYAYYKDTVNISTQSKLHQTIMMKSKEICQKDKEINELQKKLAKENEIIMREVEKKEENFNKIVSLKNKYEKLAEENNELKKKLAIEQEQSKQNTSSKWFSFLK